MMKTADVEEFVSLFSEFSGIPIERLSKLRAVIDDELYIERCLQLFRLKSEELKVEEKTLPPNLVADLQVFGKAATGDVTFPKDD